MGRTPLAWLADRLILRPSRHPLDVAGKTRRAIPFAGGTLECWTHRTGAAEREPDVFVLKYPGAGGRAERATDHPLGGWPDWCGEIWAVNPPGYGGSPGPATLQTLVAVARAAWEEVQRAAAGRPILVAGSSLGAAAALAAAAHGPVAGLLLRNPPPMREVVRGRFGGRGWRWFTEWIARQIPEPLSAIANARQATAPAVFVVSGRDRTVPPHYQQLIIDAYAGEKQVLRLAEADHHSPLTAVEQREYQTLLGWLRGRMTAGNAAGR
jgi:uncharacterized protein